MLIRSSASYMFLLSHVYVSYFDSERHQLYVLGELTFHLFLTLYFCNYIFLTYISHCLSPTFFLSLSVSPLGGEKHLHCDVVAYITKRSGCDPKSSCLDDVQNHRAIIWHHSEKTKSKHIVNVHVQAILNMARRDYCSLHTRWQKSLPERP
jgi:hypothetical protein